MKKEYCAPELEISTLPHVSVMYQSDTEIDVSEEDEHGHEQ